MIPQEQQYPHDPDNGVYGDCFRASIASIMNLDINDVPHFLFDNCPVETFRKRVTEFLALHGLCLIEFSAWDMQKYLDAIYVEEVYHLIGGPSPRFADALHSVVGRNGVIVHDPHPDKSGLVGDSDDYAFGFLVRLCT